MKFSLIMASVGRIREPERFLASLAVQTYRDYEVIVVDQNRDDRLIPLLESYETQFSIKHLRSAPGLSRARNVGLKHITGDVVAFPDDDCWYPPRLLEGVCKLFQTDPKWDILAVAPLDNKGNPFLSKAFVRHNYLTQKSVWGSAISWNLFMKAYVPQAVGYFDETLGVGAGTRWGSGEETDFLLRAMQKGFRIWSEPGLVVYHETAYVRLGVSYGKKAYRYALGMGRVLRKNRYPITLTLYFILKPLLGAVAMLAMVRPHKAFRYGCMFSGRLIGFLSTSGIRDSIRGIRECE